ncbi:MAG: S8 family serine peptidase, partial [Acidimicrobiales bacterium]
NAGVSYALAAGNADADACDVSPARVGPAITVGASNISDERAAFSNKGPCVDLFAPGVGITSDSIVNAPQTQVFSGTSMASPHVAGAIALILESAPTTSPAAVAKVLLEGATSGVISDAAGSPNLLLYTRELRVGPFGVTVSPSERGLPPGQSVSFQVSVTTDDDFDAPVSLRISGLPNGANATFSPPSLAGGGISTLVITTSASTPKDTFELIVTGQSGSETSSSSILLEVATPDFALDVVSDYRKIAPGGSTVYTVHVDGIGGFDNPVGLQITGLPNGATASFTPSSVIPETSASLTVNTTTSTIDGTYTATIRGQSGGAVRTTTIVLEVRTPDISVSLSPTSHTVQGGQLATKGFIVKVHALHGFSGVVGLAADTSALPAGVTVNLPDSLTIPADAASWSASAIVFVQASAAPGSYAIIFEASQSGKVRTATAMLNISEPPPGETPDFEVSLSPSTLSVTGGKLSVRAFTFRINALHGFSGQLDLRSDGSALPDGVRVNLPASVNISPGTTSRFISSTVFVEAVAATGSYSLEYEASHGGSTRKATATLHITVP